jgi:ubiquinone/menaquinone biosynthesis C-methylase UbiE
MIISNYVLMDLEDLPGAMRAFNRVLKPGGIVVLIFSHPCFPQGYATVRGEYDLRSYKWNFNYFEESRQLDPPWGHFTSDFIGFHRPLSDYWKAFKKTGLK